MLARKLVYFRVAYVLLYYFFLTEKMVNKALNIRFRKEKSNPKYSHSTRVSDILRHDVIQHCISDVPHNGGALVTMGAVVDHLLAILFWITIIYSHICLIWVIYSNGYMLKVRNVSNDNRILASFDGAQSSSPRRC